MDLSPKRRRLGVNKPEIDVTDEGKAVASSPRSPAAPSPASSNTRFRVLITVKLPVNVSKYLKDLCYQAVQQGIFIDVASWEKDAPMPKERLKSMLAANEYHAILCTLNDQITREILDLAPTLKLISTMSVGYDHVDVSACQEKGIKIGHTPGVLTDTCADLTLALLLAVARRVTEAGEAVRSGDWGAWNPTWMCGKDVHHSTVGIVGLGRIGATVAKRLRAFDCKILYTGPKPKPNLAASVNAEYVSFEELVRKSDFISVHCPLNESTRHLFDESVFSKMKNDCILINTSRGPIVDQKALLVALKENRIGGAGLDVTETEPLDPSDPLLDIPNCIILPHISSASTATRHRMASMSVDNLIAGLFGLTSLHLGPQTPTATGLDASEAKDGLPHLIITPPAINPSNSDAESSKTSSDPSSPDAKDNGGSLAGLTGQKRHHSPEPVSSPSNSKPPTSPSISSTPAVSPRGTPANAKSSWKPPRGVFVKFHHPAADRGHSDSSAE